MNIHQWNNEVLKRKGIKSNAAYPKAVIRTVGDAKRATLVDGTVVERQEYIFVDGYGLVKTLNYELHFIYSTPKHMKGWSFYCTCGSIAGVVGIRDYSKLVSPQNTGFVLACIRHTATKSNTGIGQHADLSTE